MQIFMTSSDEHYDYSNCTYYFVNEYGYLKFHQMGSFDLAFTVHKFDSEQNKVSFTIGKDKYPQVYGRITSMLAGIEELKYLSGTNRLIPEYEMLYENGYFSWKSDAPANETTYMWHNEDFKYHYFNIHQNADSYIFEFICSTETPYFTVEVNTDRSRYAELRFPIWEFFNKLDEVCENVDEDKAREILKQYHNQRVNKKNT